MEAKELRIGNYVYAKEIETVKAIGIEDYIWFDKERNLSVELCQPIPLTEEWLLKFGFMKIDGSFFKLSFLFYGLKIKDAIGFQFRKGEFLIQLKYVHQLQNLYFALVGEELTFKSE
jgi:hypothetical protein